MAGLRAALCVAALLAGAADAGCSTGQMKHTVRTQFGNQDVCLDCHAGLYCDNSDGCPFPCKLCPLGRYQDQTKQTGCKSCGCGDSGDTSRQIGPHIHGLTCNARRRQ